MKVLVVFDDTVEKSEIIVDVIGDRGFSDVVVKRKRLEDYYCEKIKSLYPQAEWRLVRSVYEFHEMLPKLETYWEQDTRVLHCFSNYMISEEEKMRLSFEKLCYIHESYRVLNSGKAAALMFRDIADYEAYIASICSGLTSADAARQITESFAAEGLVDISIVENFIHCIAGNFDSRYFNSLQGDAYTLVKSSTDKKKIKSEYMYYYLLPEDMRFWYVMPFHYEENEQKASYRMERLHMTDLAVRWIHGSIDEEEFGQLMDKYLYFFQNRHCMEITEEAFVQISNALYVDKVKERVTALKKTPKYDKIADLMAAACHVRSIDALVEKYFRLKEQIEGKNKYPCVAVIGHGDPCFANALYSKSTKTLKFIDPKGALTERELWTNPYYDVAKLSHSVCGCYDFFNNALFEIRIDESFACTLDIPFDNSKYIQIFRCRLKEQGYDYLTVRLYEASLFLSMLPLHIDYPHKVFGFILNTCRILEEIERYVQ